MWTLGRRAKEKKKRQMIHEISNLLIEFFGKDQVKIGLWMKSPNPLLGGLIPNDMIAIGRGERLLQFMKHALEENKR